MITLWNELQRLMPGRITPGCSLSAQCTWRIGGPADAVLAASGPEQAAQAFALCAEHGVPVTLVGGGSNLLFSDQGVRGLVLCLDPEGAPVSIRGHTLRAGAGASIRDVALAAARAGLGGLEHASNIPGTLGGLVVMNGGSNRCAIGDRVTCITTISRTGEVRRFRREECGFDYRTSVFQHAGVLVTEVELSLEPDDPQAVHRRMAHDLAVRRSKFPLELPSCGSVFKSSPGLYEAFGPPGMVIDRLGLKGTRVGDIQVSPMHANFFVNLGQGTAGQVLELVDMVRERVLAETGHLLECEVRHVSPGGSIRPLHEVLDRGLAAQDS